MILAVAAFAVAAFTSCGKQPEPEAGEPSAAVLHFSGDRPSVTVDTKTFWNGSDVFWSAGDRIAVTYSAADVWASSALSESDPLQEDAEKGLFSVPTSISAIPSSTRFYAIYPSSAASDLTSVSALPEISVTVPSEQHLSAGSFDSSADILSSSSRKTYSSVPSEAVPLVWKRAVGHLALTVSSPSIGEGESIESIVLTADSDAAIAGEFSLDITSGLFTAASGDTPHNVLKLIPPGTEIADGQEFIASIAPCTMTSLEVKIVTDVAEYSKTINASLPILRDRRHTLGVDMSSATRTLRKDPAKEASVNSRIFEILDLSRSGLEDVRTAYGDNRLYDAATALKAYWTSKRSGIVNPEVDLTAASTISAFDKNIADQALKENGYRFYVKNYSESTDKSTALATYYSFLGSDGGIDWTTSPTTETQFALQKHRHQWVDAQARAYNATGDEKYVQAIIDVYSDWLKTYPCPGASASSYAIADGGTAFSDGNTIKDLWTDLQATSRLLTYTAALERCIGAECFTPEFLTHLLVSLYDTAESIIANPYYKDASNHRLYEVQAVYSASVLLPEFAEASSWESTSLGDIATQCSVQFASDGVQNEMDPSYHISVISLFYDIWRLASVNSKSDPISDKTLLQSACGFVRDIMYPDYSIENFNDTRSTSWTKSVLKKNFSKYAEMFPSEGSFLYLSSEGSEGTAPTSEYAFYTSSGWYVLRDGWNEGSAMMILKNNANPDQWWHCQGDNGTVSLYRNGRNFLPDAGVYTYGGSASDNAQRTAFRSTAMHNTLTYGGATIADDMMNGVFAGEAHTDVYDAVRSKNQSYSALRHERTVFRVKDGGFFVVADAAIGSATGSDVALHWHFCPGCSVAFSSSDGAHTAATTFSDGNNMLFKTFCFNGLEASTDWSATTGTSYTSDNIGVKTSRDCCAVSLSKSDASTPVRFITVIYPVQGSSAAPEIEATYTSASKLQVKAGSQTYTLTIP